MASSSVGVHHKTEDWPKNECVSSHWGVEQGSESRNITRSALSARLSAHLLVVSPQHLQLSGAHQDVRSNRRQLLTGFLWSPAV